jgi:uncharacterized protein (DUF58 family)
MKRLYILILSIYGFLLLSFITRNGILLTFTLPFLIYLIFGLIYGPDDLRLRVNRTLSMERTHPGTAVQITLAVTNLGKRIERLLIADPLPNGLNLVEGHTRIITSLQTGETFTLKYSVCGPRGYYHFEDVYIRASDHLGVRLREKANPATGRLFILPEAWRLRRVNIKPPRTRVYAGFIPTRQGGPGVEFYGVREYQQGDPLRWINWSASARREQAYFVNQFEQDRVAEIVIVLDARKKADVKISGGENIFEYCVQAAASLVETFIADGNRVGLLAYGTPYLDWAFPGYGKVQREKIMRALSRAKPVESLVFDSIENLPVRLFHPRTQILVITSLHKGDHEHIIRLRALGYSVLLISPDPVAFISARTSNPSIERSQATRLAHIERTLMLNRMRQAQVQVLDWDVQLPFESAIHKSLSRSFPKTQISGFNP